MGLYLGEGRVKSLKTVEWKFKELCTGLKKPRILVPKPRTSSEEIMSAGGGGGVRLRPVILLKFRDCCSFSYILHMIRLNPPLWFFFAHIALKIKTPNSLKLDRSSQSSLPFEFLICLWFTKNLGLSPNSIQIKPVINILAKYYASFPPSPELHNLSSPSPEKTFLKAPTLFSSRETK